MFKRKLIIASICAMAFSAFAIASPVDLEQTNILMSVNAQLSGDVVPATIVEIDAHVAHSTALVTDAVYELVEPSRIIEPAFVLTTADSELHLVTHEVGWRF